jgi:polyisoprenyl-teichoic acid--peptidoglycan teichoic acid transferase
VQPRGQDPNEPTATVDELVFGRDTGGATPAPGTHHDPDHPEPGAAAGDREHPSPARRRVRRLLVGAALVILLALLAVVAFGGYVVYRVEDNIAREPLLPASRPGVTAPDGTRVPETGNGTNVLVVGTDTRGTERGRSDVILLVHIPRDAASVYVIHFPRDLWVPIPRRGENKINAAYAVGGEPLLVETVESLLKVRIQHVARTDFDGFKAMTDAVGGVRVYAEEASGGAGNGGPVVIRKGWNRLDGEGALAFVRERYDLSEGDISRGRRQLAFVKALLLEAISPDTLTDPVRLARFADAATENLVVDEDLTLGAMRDYAFALRDIRSGDVVFATAPFRGFGTSPGGASIDLVDEKQMAELGEALRTDRMNDYLDVFVTP